VEEDRLYRDELVEDGLKVLDRAVMEGIDGFLTLRLSAVFLPPEEKTYGKLPSRLPQDLQRALVREDGIELVSEDPVWHFDYCSGLASDTT